MNYVGLDVHKRTISFCVRSPYGMILQEGSMTALREELDELVAEVPAPCMVVVQGDKEAGPIPKFLALRSVSLGCRRSSRFVMLQFERMDGSEASVQALAAELESAAQASSEVDHRGRPLTILRNGHWPARAECVN